MPTHSLALKSCARRFEGCCGFTPQLLTPGSGSRTRNQQPFGGGGGGAAARGCVDGCRGFVVSDPAQAVIGTKSDVHTSKKTGLLALCLQPVATKRFAKLLEPVAWKGGENQGSHETEAASGGGEPAALFVTSQRYLALAYIF